MGGQEWDQFAWQSQHSPGFIPLQDGVELRLSKTVGMVAQGSCRSLIIYRCELGDQGVYMCDAHDAQTSASLKVQGEGWVGGCKSLLAPLSSPASAMPLPSGSAYATRPAPSQRAGGRW